MITLKNVKKYYNKDKQNEKTVIDDVSLELPSKGMVSILGKSGCGKTTLLNCIGGISEISGGEILIDEEHLDTNDNVRNKKIGYIFQNFCLNPSENVLENVSDALRIAGAYDENEISSLAMSALESVGMDKFWKRKPNTLSGGQQQRIAIARAIVKNPSVVLADEPTGNLDAENTRIVMELLKRISAEHLVVLVTHENDIANLYSDMIIELSDGKIEKIKEIKELEELENLENTGNEELPKRVKIRDNNVIYLGDMEMSTVSSDFAQLEYYGPKTDNPLNIKLVNYNGQIYLELGNQQVKLLDSNCEIKLKEGSFDNECSKEEAVESSFDAIVINDLVHKDDTQLGRLYDVVRIAKEGWKRARTQKKSVKLLRKCLFVFGIAIVFLTAFFGIGFKSIIESFHANDDNIFYVSFSSSDKANQVINKIENGHLGNAYIFKPKESFLLGKQAMCLVTPKLESSISDYLDETLDASFECNVLGINMIENDMFDIDIADIADVSDNEIVITSRIADDILKDKQYDFINSQNDLIGMYCKDPLSRGYEEIDKYKIVGITDSQERNVYKNGSHFEENKGSGEYIIYTDNPKELDEYLKEMMVDEYSAQWQQPYYNAKMLNKLLLKMQLENHALTLFIWFVIAIILCVGVALLMKSEIIKRIKTIGIYRCIGATKMNIAMLFAGESLIMMVTSSGIGFLLGSIIVWYLRYGKYSYMTMTTIYYPFWFGCMLFLIITVISVIGSIAPVLKILKRQPSEIMSQYDI